MSDQGQGRKRSSVLSAPKKVGRGGEGIGTEHTTFMRYTDKAQNKARNYEDCRGAESPNC